MSSIEPSPSSSKEKLVEVRRQKPRLFWFYIALAVFVTAIIPALVCGLYFGLVRPRSTTKENPLSVNLGYSTYVGTNAENGVSQWLGIRYAEAPVGDLRFRAPRDPVVDGAVHAAQNHGPICHFSPSTSYNPSRSEDCLFLDVYAPTKKGHHKHPVFVFFQGGGFNTLSSPNLNGNSLINAADHDLVVVTFNYRVGPYGFLASKEVQENGDLNAGLLDQRKVLEWIQKHIHLFDGDPNHVTIGGGSAGGAAVALHMSAYGGRNDNLFHAAAAESQSFGKKLNVSESQYEYDALIQRVGCKETTDTLRCLRDTNITTLTSNDPNIPAPNGPGSNPVFMWSPCIDGNFISDSPYNAFAHGKFVKVPSIFGDTTNEGTIFTPRPIASAQDMNHFLGSNFPGLTPAQHAQIESFYPVAEQYPGKGEYWKAAANAYGEMRYICPGIYLSHTVFTSNTPSWNYRWDVLSPTNAANGLGVTHNAEGAAIWGVAGAPDSALTPMMQAYWTSFIRTYDPNKYKLSSAPTWEQFGAGDGLRLHVPNEADQTTMGSPPPEQLTRCQYLSSIGPSIGQ